MSHGSQDLYPTYLQSSKGFSAHNATVATIIGNCVSRWVSVDKQLLIASSRELSRELMQYLDLRSINTTSTVEELSPVSCLSTSEGGSPSCAFSPSRRNSTLTPLVTVYSCCSSERSFRSGFSPPRSPVLQPGRSVSSSVFRVLGEWQVSAFPRGFVC